MIFFTAPDDVEMMINHVNEVTCREGVAIAVAEEDDRLRKNVQEYLVVPPRRPTAQPNPSDGAGATRRLSYGGGPGHRSRFPAQLKQNTDGGLMNAIIADPLPYRVETGSLLAALHVRGGSEQVETVTRLVAEAQQRARPKAIYRIAYVDAKGDDFVVAEGHTFTSRVLRVNLDKLHRFFVFVGTAGRELEAGPTRSRRCSPISMPMRSVKPCCTRR